MLNPSIGKLINVYESRYQLVLDVAKYARHKSHAMALTLGFIFNVDSPCWFYACVNALLTTGSMSSVIL